MIPVDRAAAPMDALGDGPTIGALLGICARKDGTRPYLRHGRRLVSYAQADRRGEPAC